MYLYESLFVSEADKNTSVDSSPSIAMLYKN